MFFMSTDVKKISILLEMHTTFSKLPILFRERVCEECNYSVPTFYRKLRSKDREVDGKIVRVLSKAEKEKIREIAEEVTNGLVAFIFEPQEK
jgi:hypothetical protein